MVVEGAVSCVLYAGLELVNGLGPDSSGEPVLGISAPVDKRNLGASGLFVLGRRGDYFKNFVFW